MGNHKRNSNTEKIDFVVLWVDGQDPKWRAERDYWKAVVNGTTPEDHTYKEAEDDKKNDFTGEMRYRDWGLMRYWFRGIEKYAPWVNHIYFVTWGHLPSWLNTAHPKLTIVPHEEFLPEEYRPTFNSNALMLNLHRIRGLSEHFVLFNDDVFLSQPVRETDFFEKGLPKDEALLDATVKADGSDDIAHLMLNVNGIINQHFRKKEVLRSNRWKFLYPGYGKELVRTMLVYPMKYFTGFRDAHVASPYLKSTFETLWEKEPELLDNTCRHKFRDKTDVSEWLMKDWQFCTGQFVPRKHSFGCHLELGVQDEKILEAVRKQRYKVLCLNDGHQAADVNCEQLQKKLKEAFLTIFPDKSSFEK